ncbi:HpcH/HpaI aldolase/citrate lyase family protein [Niveispirillum fermenti]|uniref:HpcH/HpaI aldolase/citrate lyase family protein n=1 Tax=Niveispirillum fermenti TaxID=1233113 RepID=UPI003A86E6D7
MMRAANWRSLLFVPGDAPAKLARAATRGADAVIIDLEDGVPPGGKEMARAGLARHVPALAAQDVAVLVRINAAWRAAVPDLAAAILPGVAAVMVPKAEDVARLSVLADMLAEGEADAGLPVGGISLVPLIETPLGLARLAEIADAPRLAGLAFGGEDFAAALAVEPTPEVLELPCRQVALAAAAHDLPAWGLPISLAGFQDLEAYCAGARRARAMGLAGALCIHPAQIAVLNESFRPSSAQIDAARAILIRWEQAAATGQGVTALDGAMIDLPVVERARRILLRAG